MENKELPKPLGHKDVPTILLVDDDPDVIEFINQIIRLFSERRFNVMFATTGEGAIGIVNLQPIDAVVLDIKLPDVTGINIGKKIKQHYPDMPMAIFTSYSGKNVRDQVEEIGAFYWYKLNLMGNPEQLLSNLNSLVSGAFKNSNSEEHIITEVELESMRERRNARMDKMQFPSYLIRSRVKHL